ncbi:MAG: hypothetical protein H8E13_06680 [Actinobacteria bacterium]|nr:hypothetical protein [Actinomycetota bacterium]
MIKKRKYKKIPDRQKEQREGVFVTNPLRTIIDSAGSNVSIDYLEQAIQEACDKGMIQIIDIAGAEMPEKAKEKIMIVFKNMKNRREKIK